MVYPGCGNLKITCDHPLQQQLAGKISLFHKNAQVIDFGKWGRPRNLMELFNDISTIRDAVKENLGMDGIIEESVAKSDRFIERNSKLIVSRKKGGKIRDCHMDLHSANIFLLENPVIIDCVEFSNDFRYGDITSDVAFMAMDLEAKNSKNLSEKFVENYLALSGDSQLTEVLPWYLAYRANVRAKIHALTMMHADGSQKEKEIENTGKYLGLLGKYNELL